MVNKRCSKTKGISVSLLLNRAIFSNHRRRGNSLFVPKSKYKLQSVLDVRDKAKQEAAERVAHRRNLLTEAEAELFLREQAVTNCRAQQTAAQAAMMQKAEKGTEARQLVAHRTHLTDLRRAEMELSERVKQQQSLVARATSELDVALDALVEAARELQVIERHQEEWVARTRRETARREQKLGDEIGAIFHERNANE